MPENFSVPPYGAAYVTSVIDRCSALIAFNIWQGITPVKLRQWMSNFVGPEEKYFAACVLDSLIYRSNPQTHSLIRQLFERSIPDLTRTSPSPVGDVHNWLQFFQPADGSEAVGVKIVLAQKRSEPRVKSASIIGRELKRKFRVAIGQIIEPWEIPVHLSQGTETFIFIDDFLGTGEQFKEMCDEEVISQHFPNGYFIYAPLVAHIDGVSMLRQNYPNLKIVAAEYLDHTNGFFNPAADNFDAAINSTEVAKEFYYRLLDAKGINLSGPERRGYGSLELCYAFEHAAPDNSLPILWWNETPTWKPLFDR